MEQDTRGWHFRRINDVVRHTNPPEAQIKCCGAHGFDIQPHGPMTVILRDGAAVGGSALSQRLARFLDERR